MDERSITTRLDRLEKLYARLEKVEAMLRHQKIHEPGCGAGHNCNRDHPEADWACVIPPCTCWIKVE